MIETANKYGNARAQAQAGQAVQTRGLKPKTPTAQPQPKAPAPARGQIFVPTPKAVADFQGWFLRELRTGGRLHKYLEREKHMTKLRMRAVARRMHGVKRNLKGDYELKACVPAREFFRWQHTDPDFWKDDNNLRSLRRDNPDAVVFV